MTIPNSVTSIGDYAFWKCSSLTSIEIPNSVTSIGKQAFRNCSGLTSVTIPNSVTSIGSNAFDGCGLTSVTIPNSVTSIEAWTFQYCSGLTSVTIPNSVTSIGYSAFYDCENLTSVTIGNSVTSIGDYAFGGCSALTSVTIPNSVTSLGKYAFSGCSALTSFTCEATTPPDCGISCFSGMNMDIPVYVPDGSVEAYKNASGWKEFTNIQETVPCEPVSGTCGAEGDNLTWKLTCDGVLTISGSGAMADYGIDTHPTWYDYITSIKEVEIGSSVTNIGRLMFYQCTNLTSVKIGESVKSIGEGAFDECSGLTSVTIPNSVTSIGDYAFYNCESLTSVTIPNSVTSIGNYAFRGSGLTSVTIPNSVTSIGEWAFSGCIDLTSVTIPNSVTSIGNGAFFNCLALTSVTIPNSVTSIGNNAFSVCYSLSSVTIPNSVTNIGNYAFKECIVLTSITCYAVTPPVCGENCFEEVSTEIPVYVPAASVEAYKNAPEWKNLNIQASRTGICGKEGDNLTWKLSDDGVLTISGTGDMADWNSVTQPWAFFHSSIQSVVIEDGVTNIGNFAFYDCSALTSVTIPNSVTHIGMLAFLACSSLTSVSIPCNVTGVGAYAFTGCTGLTSITCEAVNPPSCGEKCFGKIDKYGEVDKSIPVYVPLESVDAYKTAYQWKDFGDNIISCQKAGTCGAEGDNLTWKLSCEGVLTISGTGAMANYTIGVRPSWESYKSDIISVVINEGVTVIGEWAFMDCGGVSSVTLPNSLNRIERFAFLRCTGLTSIDIPDGVTGLVSGAFDQCSAMKSVTMGKGLTVIGDYVFRNCTALTALTIGSNVTTINSTAFFGCTALSSVTIPNSVTTIGNAAFRDCSSLSSLTLGSGVATIAESAFQGCGLVSVTIPASVTSIEKYAFCVCPVLTSMDVAATNPKYSSLDGVLFDKDQKTLIEYPACKKGAYTIPDGVTTIEHGAFYGCSNLTSVTISATVTGMKGSAFYNCSGLESVTCEAVNPPLCENSCFYNVDNSIPVFVPAGSVADYQNDTQWSYFSNILPIAAFDISDLAAKNITATSADISWTGTGESYDLRYKVNNNNGFESDMDGWTTIDADGDGYTWMWGSNASAFVTHYESSGCVASASYINGFGALEPDNWLVSPQITLGGTMTFWATGQDNSYIAEHFQVYVSTSGNTDPADFTAVSPEYINETSKNYRLYTVDLSAYSGKGYVAIRHFNCTDMFWLLIDDIEIIEPGAWTEVNGLTAANHTLSGLKSTTIYDVQVRSRYGAMTGDWQQVLFKTVASAEDIEAANKVMDLINAIGTVTLASEEAIVTARTAYDKLTEGQKELVTNYDLLTAAEKALEKLKANIPTVDNGWVYYDDGIYSNAYSTGGDEIWGIRIPANTVTKHTLTKVSMYVIEPSEFEVTIYAGGATPAEGTKLYTEVVSMPNANEFNEVTLATPVTIDPAQDIWVIFHNTVGYYDPLSLCDKEGAINASWLYIEDKWYISSDLGYPNITWMIRAYFEDEPEVPAGKVAYKLVDLSKESLTEGKYLIVFDDNKAHAEVSGKDFVASSDELTFEGNYIFVPEEKVWDVTIQPFNTDSFSILLADGTTYLDLQEKNSVTTSTMESGFAITAGENKSVEIAKYLPSEDKTYVLKHNGKYFRMYSGNVYILPQLYRKQIKNYTVTWLDWDGSELGKETYPSGEKPAYKGTEPAREATTQYTYTFSGWSPEIKEVTEDVTYTAVFKETTNSYTVTWKNWDGTELAKEACLYGSTPEYKGIAPARSATAQFSYIFEGWSPEIKEVTGEAVYTAVFKETTNSYTVTWKNWDGAELGKETSLYGSTPEYKGSAPAREATVQFSYTFTGWSPAVAAVTGDATYTAVFKETTNSYSVTWKMDDGSELGKETYAYGEMPAHEAPAKEATAQYSYTFAGWTPAISKVTGDAAYTAVFKAAERSYTVIWVNWDGAELSKETCLYGTTPAYKGATPARPATAENTFSFTGWSPAIAPVKGDVTYKAQFSSTGQTYTVTWKMDDGTELGKETYAYGDMPGHDKPSKPATAQYTYTFKGWTPELKAVSGDATYTAVFKAVERSYTVTWLNWDGAELGKETCLYGATPAYKGATPARPATEQYTFSFTGWSPDITAVTGDVTYKAQFKQTENTYTVTWKSDDGTELGKETYTYGEMPAHEAPVKAATEQYSYTFTGWSPALKAVTSDATYTAVFKAVERTYTVIWKNWDGSELAKETYAYGITPIYKGVTPAREATAQFSYTFTGWSPAVVSVKGDAAYTAVFKETANSYTVTWKMDDGSELGKETYAYGSMPSHAAPVKEETAQYTYTFEGWTPALKAVSGDATYTAVFKAVERSYTVIWLNWDGTELAKETYAYGTKPEYKGATPAREATAQFSYTFTGWSPAITAVKGDVTYKAQFSSAGQTYTVTWKMDDGTELGKETYAYGDMPSHDKPSKPSTAQYTYTFEGWTPELKAVSGDAAYTAVFKAEVRTYNVIWINWDGTEMSKETYLYGATPDYKGKTPVRPATTENIFTFTGWSPAIVPVTGDVTYKAQFTSAGQTYTVTWKMDNGSVLAKETYAYGEIPSRETPVKPATAQYNYTFEGWTPEIKAVSGDATYTAVFKAEVRTYTVTWLNWDGTELGKESYAYGSKPEYKGNKPVKAATAQFSYTFTGWSPEIAEVTGDAAYTAAFKETTNTYTVTWKMDDGSELGKETYAYGEMPGHNNPYKPATAQFNYTFAGWSPSLVPVTGDATYTAVFKAEERSYTVTWVNWDGTTLVKESYTYGVTPAYNGAVPVRPATEQNTFTFTGWSPDIAAVTGDVTYKAQFTSAGQTYTVTWKMDDGTELGKETYAYGETPSRETPVKPATAQYTYTFEGWTPEIKAVSGDAAYTAVFKAVERSYTVTWVNWDGNELAKETYAYGAKPEYKGTTPARPATAENTFTFTGWSPVIAAVTGDVTYKAQFSSTGQTYTVTWKMDDGSELGKETYVYGDMPSHAAPVKEETAQHTYTFTGWSPEITEVTEDATYTAVFKAEERSYTVTWVNWDGNELGKETYLYGATPEYKGSTPVKPATEQNVYTFTGWSPAVGLVTGDVTYKAQFSSAGVTYTVTFLGKDGNVLDKQEVFVGGAAVAPEAPEVEGFTFTGWDKKFDVVIEDMTVKALYEEVIDLTPTNLAVVLNEKDGDVQLVFSWDKVDGVPSYEVKLIADGEELGAMNTFGQNKVTLLLSQVLAMYSIPAGTYTMDWEVRSTDIMGKAVSDWAQGPQFEITVKGDPTAVDQVPSGEPQSTKVLMDGLIYILRDGKTFTITGQKVN